MISKTGRYWSTGITVTHYPDRDAWAAYLEFLDDGFTNDDPDTGRVSTEGTLHTRYYVRGLRAAVTVLKADAEKLGVEFRGVGDSPPMLYYRGDGEWPDYPPPQGWRQMLADLAAELGWCSYDKLRKRR